MLGIGGPVCLQFSQDMWLCSCPDAGNLKVLPRLNFTPAMVVAVKTLHLAAIVRVTLSPVLHDAPFVGGFSFCFLDMPYLDFDLRCAYTHASWLPLSPSCETPFLAPPRLSSCSVNPTLELACRCNQLPCNMRLPAPLCEIERRSNCVAIVYFALLPSARDDCELRCAEALEART